MRFFISSMLPLCLLACGDKDDDTGHHAGGGDYATMQTSDGGTFMVSYETDPTEVGVSDEFSVIATIMDADGAMIMDAESVEIDGSMPAHGHGMNVTPVTTDNGDGTWTATPLKFHMEGDWQLDVAITHGGATETASFTYSCCG